MKILLNGEPAGVDDLRCLVQVNYGHFTVMRVEQGGVRGLDLHLDRLQRTTRELFGTDLDRARVRDYLRRAVSGETRDLSVRINIFSRALDREHLDKPSSADVLVIAAPASQSPVTPLRLKSFRYTREVAAIKHVGTFALFHFRRMAQQAGFDDALFVDEEGRISEGSIWNIGFVDSKDGVVWPDAPQLDGISMQLLKSALSSAGVRSVSRTIRLADLGELRAAFFTNASVPVRPIASIDEHRFVIDDTLTAKLTRCYALHVPQSI